MKIKEMVLALTLGLFSMNASAMYVNIVQSGGPDTGDYTSYVLQHGSGINSYCATPLGSPSGDQVRFDWILDCFDVINACPSGYDCSPIRSDNPYNDPLFHPWPDANEQILCGFLDPWDYRCTNYNNGGGMNGGSNGG